MAEPSGGAYAASTPPQRSIAATKPAAIRPFRMSQLGIDGGLPFRLMHLLGNSFVRETRA